ncbi:CsbA family protein [Bacillus alkalisoli]|uniref:CsbA family protein n=1 Tax=Bacillus alkalisoli TaxID=2011008 RepID=UPI000C234B9C|nr:CsbA family protein [Bacillus alkalisoli]
MKVLLAIFLPALLVILFTRVTFNAYVGTALTAALIVAAILKGHSDEWFIIVLDIVSLGVGFLYARTMFKKKV